MLHAFAWGLLATSSLILGGLIASRFTLSKRTIGIIMAFGAGALISAVAYELVYESVRIARLTGFPALGLFTGAATFYFSDQFISQFGARHRTDLDASAHTKLVVPMVLAIILDGIPESLVIGLGLSEGGAVSLAMLVAVFMSNLPEAIAGSVGLKAGGASSRRIILLWCLIALVCAFASVAGYSLFHGLGNRWLSFVQSFAGGAILMMLANSMMPEAYEHGGKLAGVFTVLGFCVAVAVVILEHL